MLDTPEENTPQETTHNYIDLTADIVSAYVAKNSVRPADLGDLIASVHQTLKGLSGPTTPVADQIKKLTLAEIKKSITPEALISFEDGKPYKTLRRHLTLRGLSPEAYRAKHGLPVDYPMTSVSYSAQRSELARALGLGQRRRGQSKSAAPDEVVSEAASGAKPKRAGRPRKTAAE